MTSGSHVEHDLTELAALLDRLSVDARPQRGEAAVYRRAALAASEASVDRDVLAEVGHPAAEPELNQVRLDDLCQRECNAYVCLTCSLLQMLLMHWKKVILYHWF